MRTIAGYTKGGTGQSAGVSSPPACSPSMGTANLMYPIPRQFTLTGTNGGGAAANFKMQSGDSVVECALNASLGPNSFSVVELPDQAGLDIGGANLLGINALRRAVQTYAVVIDYINYSASTSAQLNNPLRFVTGNIDGTTTSVARSVARDKSNMQFDNTLIPIDGPILLTANTGLQLSVNAGATVNLACAISKLVPYSQIL